MTIRWTATVMVAFIYAILFVKTDYVGTKGDPNYLPATMTLTVHQASTGYLHQLDAERLYIKVMTFKDATTSKATTPPYADALSNHFEIMQHLHPYLFDTYWATEAFLPWYGDDYVRRANTILQAGINYQPNRWEIPFFLGWNHFYYLGDSHTAYDYLIQSSKISGNNFMRHLAAVLAAKEGNLEAGLTWLRTMRNSEQDEKKRKYMSRDVDAYEKAIMVQKKVHQFRNEKGQSPKKLQELIPEYLDSLPEIKSNFEIVYEGGIVSLQRPNYRDIRPSSKRGNTSQPE